MSFVEEIVKRTRPNTRRVKKNTIEENGAVSPWLPAVHSQRSDSFRLYCLWTFIISSASRNSENRLEFC